MTVETAQPGNGNGATLSGPGFGINLRGWRTVAVVVVAFFLLILLLGPSAAIIYYGTGFRSLEEAAAARQEELNRARESAVEQLAEQHAAILGGVQRMADQLEIQSYALMLSQADRDRLRERLGAPRALREQLGEEFHTVVPPLPAPKPFTAERVPPRESPPLGWRRYQRGGSQ